MNLVDSSAWIEWFNAGPNSPLFRDPILDLPNLLVPTIVLFEVARRAAQSLPAEVVAEMVRALRRGRLIALDETLALSAAKLGVEMKLAMADSIIYATAQALGATLWTQDADFNGLPGVHYLAKA